MARISDRVHPGTGRSWDTRLNKIILVFFLSITSVFEVSAQLPVVKVRFANPVYNVEKLVYRVDIEFQSDKAGLEVFGMNVRFLYDDAVFEFITFENFKGQYGTSGKPMVLTGRPESGKLFGFTGPFEFVNGAVELKSPSEPVPLTTNTWTRIFSAQFAVKDPLAFTQSRCCPDLLWEMDVKGQGGIFLGDEGVVITAVDPSPDRDSYPVNEKTINLSMNSETGKVVITDDPFDSTTYGISIWPNPTKGPVNIYVPWKDFDNLEVKVLNVLGQELSSKSFTPGNRFTINLSGYAAGTYIIQTDVLGVSFLNKIVLDKR